MTTYYVGAGGNNANAGTSWALRKLTLNGAEDIPVAANDTVYVGPGVYRETLTCDVSGAAGQPITYIGDYTGANTDGVGGVVRITGSDNDQTAARANCITDNGKSYRTFRGFACDGVAIAGNSYIMDFAGSPTNIIVEQCYFSGASHDTAYGIRFDGDTQGTCTVRNCIFTPPMYSAIAFNNTSAVDNAGHVIENIIAYGCMNSFAILANYVGGVTIRNSFFMNLYHILAQNLSAGQVVTVNNCIIVSGSFGVIAGAAGMLVEDYNCFYGTITPRTNVAAGANSNTYLWLPDTRWFFETVGGGDMVTPFDLSAWSRLINVAGTAPTTTDMRNTGAIGGVREWGPLEYDTTLLVKCAAGGGAPRISPVVGRLGG